MTKCTCGDKEKCQACSSVVKEHHISYACPICAGTLIEDEQPFAALAARQMRDAAHWWREDESGRDGAGDFADLITALPVPEVQWRNLTDDEIKQIVNDCTSDDHGYDIWCDGDSVARAVIAKFKEKQL